MICNRISRQGLPPLIPTMAQKLTRQRGMTTTQPKKLQTATTGPTTCKVEEQQTNEQPRRGPTATAGPQLCKVESTRTRIKERTSEQTSITEPVMSLQNNSIQFHCKQHHQKNGMKLYCNTYVQ